MEDFFGAKWMNHKICHGDCPKMQAAEEHIQLDIAQRKF
jgi:hypothetical protein